MTRARKIRRAIVLTTAFVAGLWLSDRWMASRLLADDAPATAPSTRPAARPEVQAVLDRVKSAYEGRTVRVEGEIASDFDVAGIIEKKAIPISGVAKSPAVYRHEAKDNVLVVSDGTTLRLYSISRNQYDDAALAADSPAVSATRADAKMVLREQNPALAIAAGVDVLDVVALEDASVEFAPPVHEGGRSFDALRSQKEGVVKTTWIDRERNVIDRVVFDYTKQLASHGAADVKRASVTLRYSKTELGGAEPDASAFAFSPPADATPIVRVQAGQSTDGEPNALVGKPAPDFDLKDLDGMSVKLSDVKGSVVVLDFWATWCPPCRASLPHLAAAGEKFKGRGVKVFAVNQQEERETVFNYVTDQKLNLTALLDSDGEVGKKYGVSGIPQTVIIGRDGTVRTVTVGFNDAEPEALSEAIEAALN